MNRACLGDLAHLVDDAIINSLCFSDIVDLLCVEQTCRYLRLLASRPEVWYSVALRLPHAVFPGILPGQRREETDLRVLILRAFRGRKNWTSDLPKPVWSRPVTITPSHCQRMLTDPHFLPGGRFFLYFADETLYCFDIEQDRYVMERKNPFVELLSSGFELRPDGNILTTCLIGRSVLNSDMAVKIELAEVDLQTGKVEIIKEILKPWSGLCKGAGGGYVMLNLPVLSGHRAAVPYLCMDSESYETSNGGMIIDFARDSVLFLSLRSFDNGDFDRRSVTFAGNHLLFVAGLGPSETTLNAVSLAHFETCWQPLDGELPWIHHDVLPAHIDAKLQLRLSTSVSPTNVRLSVHASTWLDLDLARRRHPSVDSVWLIDAALIHRDARHELAKGKLFSQLYFAEPRVVHEQSQLSPAIRRASGVFITTDEDSSHAQIELPSKRPLPFDVPTRTGRLVAQIKDEGVIKTMAVQANMPQWRPLHHLAGKLVRHYILDYYTGIALRSSQIRDRQSPGGSAEMVVEGYD